MQLNISLLLFFLFILNSCTVDDSNKKIITTLIEKKDNIVEKIQNPTQKLKSKSIQKHSQVNKSFPIYIIGESYFIEGVQYSPQEDYSYIQTGLASYYDKELHNKKTVNNELNKVTELFARHKTLPLPSVVKITNLENGLSVIARVNDRFSNNSTIIEVSRKVAQLLRFYKNKLAKVRVEILSDPSKQLKIVTLSMNNPDFNSTIESAPTENVIVTDLDEIFTEEENLISDYEQPIELGFETVSNKDLFVKIDGFDSYEEVKVFLNTLNNNYKTTTQNEGDEYILLFGPISNKVADKLFQILISKGYKNAEIIIE